MARLNSGLRLVRAIFLLLALAGALIGAFAEAGQQAKRARTPKSADANPTDLDEARAASHAKIIRENNFGVALMNRQQFEQALGKFQRACILEPQSDIGCVNAGIAFLNMQRFDEARQLLSKSAERDPRNPRVWFNLGLLEKAAGKSDAAIENFTKVAQLDPYDADTQYFIGLVYSQEHQYD
ncbi:MAG TPA: tetratricopeptide repeat protein, partial [Candidatus Sulfotelmatobacter sp.]|nr:tetratricopeptide repeat protein [Candidatus Sulfotelmatobacter sp.]